MTDKYVRLESGTLKEKTATTASAGVANAGEIVGLDASGKLDETLMPTGVGSSAESVQASEDLSAGDWVNIWDDAGTRKVRKADATGSGEGKRAVGFVKAGATSGGNATVYYDGINDSVTGQTIGPVFLSTTAGSGTDTAPSATGNIVQEVGYAISTTSVFFCPSKPVEVE